MDHWFALWLRDFRADLRRKEEKRAAKTTARTKTGDNVKPTNAKKSGIAALALALALALPASTLAATSTTIDESFSVASTLSVSVNTNTLAYEPTDGTLPILAGDSIYANFTVTAQTNDADGLTITGTGSALTNGSATIPASARSFNVDNGPAVPGATFTYSNGTSVSSLPITSRIQLPGDVAAGDWSGTIVVSVSDNN